MPVLILRKRRGDLLELMDDPDCDPVLLTNTYRQFYHVNRLLSGYFRIYKKWIRPEIRHGAVSILDIGCGGGDLAARLSRWSLADGLTVQITAADPDPNAISFMRQQRFASNIEICRASTTDLLNEARTFDIVLSNHVLHHIDENDITAFISQTSTLSNRLALHNDIRRDDLAFAGFLPIGSLFRRSFILPDGLRSIRRSFLPSELEALVPSGWRVHTMPLFRNLLIWQR